MKYISKFFFQQEWIDALCHSLQLPDEISAEEKDRILEATIDILYRHGRALNDVGRLFGRTGRGIRYHLRQIGTPTRQAGGNNNPEGYNVYKKRHGHKDRDF
jgi:predicted RNA-binding protein YlqC (UPF0109 family)